MIPALNERKNLQRLIPGIYECLEDAEVTIGADTTFVNPILADDPVVIIAALRTEPSKKADNPEQQ